MAKAAAKNELPVEQVLDMDGQSLLDQIVETGIRPRGEEARERATDLVQTLAQGMPPTLLPAFLPPVGASAIPVPTANTMGAAPGCPFLVPGHPLSRNCRHRTPMTS